MRVSFRLKGEPLCEALLDAVQPRVIIVADSEFPATERLVKLACAIPIKGGNVLDVVFDATALRLWVSYAGGGMEAYQRPFVYLDLMKLDGDQDQIPDLDEGARDQDQNGHLDFLDSARP